MERPAPQDRDLGMDRVRAPRVCDRQRSEDQDAGKRAERGRRVRARFDGDTRRVSEACHRGSVHPQCQCASGRPVVPSRRQRYPAPSRGRPLHGGIRESVRAGKRSTDLGRWAHGAVAFRDRRQGKRGQRTGGSDTQGDECCGGCSSRLRHRAIRRSQRRKADLRRHKQRLSPRAVQLSAHNTHHPAGYLRRARRRGHSDPARAHRRAWNDRGRRAGQPHLSG